MSAVTHVPILKKLNPGSRGFILTFTCLRLSCPETKILII